MTIIILQALESYQAALHCNPDNKEVASKVKALTRVIRSAASQNGNHKEASNGSITSQQQYDSTKAGLVSTTIYELR